MWRDLIIGFFVVVASVLVGYFFPSIVGWPANYRALCVLVALIVFIGLAVKISNHLECKKAKQELC